MSSFSQSDTFRSQLVDESLGLTTALADVLASIWAAHGASLIESLKRGTIQRYTLQSTEYHVALVVANQDQSSLKRYAHVFACAHVVLTVFCPHG